MKFEKNFAIAYYKRRKPVWTILESIVITGLFLLLMVNVSPGDPFFLTGPFSWLAFAPVICALFFGTLSGVVSLLILLIYMIIVLHVGIEGNFALRISMLGTSILTLFTGLCSSYWLSRVKHIEHLNAYLREHLESLSRDYFQLRISHEKIEHSYIVKPLSFRGAVYQIKSTIHINQGVIDESVCKQLLNVFSQYSSLSRAAFCLYDAEKHTLNPIAYLGKEFIISMTDPLIQNCMARNITTYLAVNTLDYEETSDYVAVIPLLDDDRKRRGFVVIKEMPFWSLTHDNLEVMSVFGSIFALQWSTVDKVEDLLQHFPSYSPEFLKEFKILTMLKKYHKVDSAMVGIIIPDGFSQQNIIYGLEQRRRSLDTSILLPAKDGKLFLTLLPITSKEGILGYKKRLANWLKSDFGLTINAKGYNFRSFEINKEPASTQLNNFLEEFTYAIH